MQHGTKNKYNKEEMFLFYFDHKGNTCHSNNIHFQASHDTI